MPRATFSTWRVAWNTATLGEILRAAKKHTGTASTIASSVPQMAICTVSIAGLTSFSMKAQLGGSMRLRKSPIQGRPLISSVALTWLPMPAHQITPRLTAATAAYCHQPSTPEGRINSSL